jgi:hypothetical protein
MIWNSCNDINDPKSVEKKEEENDINWSMWVSQIRELFVI